MPRNEQENAQVSLDPRNPFDLTMVDNSGKHRLAIEEPLTFGEGSTKETQDLMRSMMVAHMVGPKLPETIYTNFDFHFSELLNALYEYYGKRKPKILKSPGKIIPTIKNPNVRYESLETVTAHSGGLDSVYRIAKLLEEEDIPLAVHLRNLNAKGNAWEAAASEAQCSEWGVPYISVRLRNNSGSHGFETMRTRDLLLALAVAIQAAPYEVKNVLIEGGMGKDTSKYHFSEQVDVWVWFNQLLKDTGLDLEVVGVDPGDIETIGEVIELEKKLGLSILPMVQNCFSAPFQVPSTRKKWERETPSIAEASSGHWCGSCHKCRRMTLGRIFYSDPKFNKVSQGEIDFFITDTEKWLQKYTHNADLISQSFLDHLAAMK